MIRDARSLTLRRCRAVDIVGDGGDSPWPDTDVLLAAAVDPQGADYLLALPDVMLAGPALAAFLARAAPFGGPIPGSLIRAYGLPDAPFPSILLREHEDAPDDVGLAYRRFLASARERWMAALGETGPMLCPALAWRAGPPRLFGPLDDWSHELAEAGVTLAGSPDAYLGRALLLLAHPALAASWPTMMSLGGVTKPRKITGREFPVWVDLPAHQPGLLASPVLDRIERLLAPTEAWRSR